MENQKLLDRLKFIRQDLDILAETLQIQGVDINGTCENGYCISTLLQNMEDATDINKSYIDSWQHYAVKSGLK
jgi:biotin operon repressor